MLKKTTGFTLMEVLIAIAIMAILAAMGYPAFSTWRESAEYRDAARTITSVMRDARSTAISRSILYQVTVNIGNKQVYYQERSPDNTLGIEQKNTEIRNAVTLRSGEGCDGAGNVTVTFRPDGSVSSLPDRICVIDKAGSSRFSVRLTSLATGRVEITRP